MRRVSLGWLNDCKQLRLITRLVKKPHLFEYVQHGQASISAIRLRIHHGHYTATSNKVFNVAFASWLAVMILNSSFFSIYFDGSPITLVRYACVIGLIISEVLSGVHSAKSLIISSIPGLLFLTPLLPTSALAYYVAIWLALSEVICKGIDRSCCMRLLTVTAITICCYSARTPGILDSALIVWCARNKDIRSITLVGFVTLVSTFCLIVVFCSFNLLDNYLIDYNSRQRWSLGFRYPLFPSMYIFLITSIFCWLRGPKISLLDIIILILANYIVLQLTDSRLSFICSIAIIIGSYLLRFAARSRVNLSYIGMLAVAAFVVSAMVSIALTYKYSASVGWMAKVNNAMTERLALGQNAIRNYGVSLFGQQIKFVGHGLDVNGRVVKGTYNYVDCLYVRLLVRHGLIGLALFVILMTKACVKAWLSNDWWLLFGLTIVAVHCIVDDLAIYLNYDLFLFAISCAIPGLGRKDEEC